MNNQKTRFFLTVLMIGGVALTGAACKPKAEDQNTSQTPPVADTLESDGADMSAADRVAPEEMPAQEAPTPPMADNTYATFALGETPDGHNTGCLWRMPPLLKPGVEVYVALARVPGPVEPMVNLQVAGAAAQNNALQPLQFTAAHIIAGSMDSDTIATTVDPGTTIAVNLKADKLEALIDAMAAASEPTVNITAGDQTYDFALQPPKAEEVAQIKDCFAKSVNPSLNIAPPSGAAPSETAPESMQDNAPEEGATAE